MKYSKIVTIATLLLISIIALCDIVPIASQQPINNIYLYCSYKKTTDINGKSYIIKICHSTNGKDYVN